MTTNKELPSNSNAERYILSGIILDNELILQTLDKISAEDFYVASHKPIYRAMEYLYDHSIEINHVTIADALKTLGLYRVETIGEIANLLQELVKGVPKSTDITYYVNILKIRSKERKKLRLSADLSTALYNGDSEAVENIEAQLNELSIEGDYTGLQPLSESVGTSVLQRAHTLGVTGTKLIGLPTGISRFDRITAGLNRQEMTILAARPAMGKEQPLDAKILTPKGWSTMGEMKIGTKIITQSGVPTTVTGVFPQGIKDVYRVTFSDGGATECGLEHLWEVTSCKKDPTRKTTFVIPLKEILKDYILSNERKNYTVKYMRPALFHQTKPLPIHPYVLGAFIGDGGLSSIIIRFSNTDRDILDKINKLLPISDELRYVKKCDYRVIRKIRNDQKTDLMTYIKDIKLNVTSEFKFIPAEYLLASISDREELLRGLMDTNGSIDIEGRMEYSTVSKSLAEDVQSLVRSLGGRAKIHYRMSHYIKENERIETKLNYRVTILFKDFNPFYCQIKRDKYELNHQIPQPRYISKIEYIGQKECQCIMVEDKSHLYVTDDYIVTHNTALALNIAQYTTKHDYVVAMFSMEMSKEMLYLRLIASEAHIDLHRLKTGVLSKVEWARAINAHDKIAKSKLLIDATSFMTPRMMEVALKKARRKYGQIDMIIVDYMQLMSSDGRRENRQQEVTEISRQLREMAKRNNAHMLALSQLSRAPETRSANGHRPQVSDLRESGAIEQDADIVAMLYREEVYNPDAVKGSAELIISKSRNSAMGTINLFYEKNYTRFENVFIS